jgi:hypothetical protein
MREICTPKHKTYKHTTWYDCVTNVTTTSKALFPKKNKDTRYTRHTRHTRQTTGMHVWAQAT